MTKRIKEQIIYIKNSGAINMFDTFGVESLAKHLKFKALEDYIQKHRQEYVRFILWGRER